ncbi:MAG: hypothetical protein GY856_46125, partial [bacterium]|nr:hypothetical protein [bacterium]
PRKSEPEIVDPDPNTQPVIAGPGDALLVRLLRLSPVVLPWKSEPEIVDPDPNTQPVTVGPDAWIDRVVHYEGVCAPAGKDDDHGDTFACATPLRLGRRVEGEIGNAWDDDLDVFALTLSEVTTVEVTVTGDAGASAALHGCSGQRLASERDDPDGRLVATLGPGRYYVRVEGGDAAAGAYELTVTARPW